MSLRDGGGAPEAAGTSRGRQRPAGGKTPGPMGTRPCPAGGEPPAPAGTRHGLAGVELLAPAGSRESLEAAVAAGADAVYMGGLRFGARAYAENPDDEGLLSAIDYVHLHGRKLYLTVNTLLKEEELEEELVKWLAPAYEQGLDAVLVQDLGVLSVIRRAFPDMEIHISTQMAVGAPWGAKLAGEMGASRLVLPRELSLEEIRAIHRETDLQLEAFVHGALCYATSGQCLLSSMIGGRSGNRGRCAQPCRLTYNGSHLLNLKDLCTLDILPDILAAGVTSLKIEGRMKGPRYTAGVVSVYRRALDQIAAEGRNQVAREDRELLLMLYDRGGGFTEGYYKKHNGADMIFTGEKPALRKMEEARLQEIDRAYLQAEIQEKIRGRAVLETGKAARLEVSLGGVTVCAEGAPVAEAKSHPMGEKEAAERLRKTGGTPFTFETLEMAVSGNAFVPVGALNALRREALEKLQEDLLRSFRRSRPQMDSVREASLGKDSLRKVPGREDSFRKASFPEENRRAVWASIENPELLPALLSVQGLEGIILPADRMKPGTWEAAAAQIHGAGKKASLALPFVLRREAWDFLEGQKKEWRKAGFDACLVRNLDEAGFLAAWLEGESEKNGTEGEKRPPFGERVFDAGLYSWNREAVRRLSGLGADVLTLPYELRKEELLGSSGRRSRGIGPGDEMVIYGRLPLMISAQCTAKTTGRCRRGREADCFDTPGFKTLTDRKRADFLEDSRCRLCQSVVYNCLPLWLGDRIPEEVRRVRFSFTDETPEEAKRILETFLEGRTEPPVPCTRGHYGRGVE